ncbi:MAG: Na/Pi cotransporter family protein [Clostridia bacterium]
MNLMSFVKLFGGLAMFIYGMTIMGNGLEKVAGSKLEKTLETVAGNLFKAISMGLLVTLVIQSSSATTVMVIGFVNAGIMNLSQSVGIILGANIGTTITAQILRLDNGSAITGNVFMTLIKPANFAYIAILVGVILLVACKSKKKHDIGTILIGFGILFIGMSTMEGAVSPLKEIPEFQQLFIMFTNPILGVIVGALVTAVIQSSSASVGILQALSTTGMITYAAAIPIILGQNIGTCITAILSSLNANKNAKRAACVHFYFNFIGTALFLIAIYSLNSIIGFDFWNENIDKAGIANFHSIFNILVVLFFVPFNKVLVRMAEKTIPYEKVPESPLSRLDKRFYNSPELALEQCGYCIGIMSEKACENYSLATQQFTKGEIPNADDFAANEKFLDTAEVEISKYLLGISGLAFGAPKMLHMEMLRTLADFEKIGDYSDSILRTCTELQASNIRLNEEAFEELKIMISAVDEVLALTHKVYQTRDAELATSIEPLEDVIDMMRELLKTNHLNRLNDDKCSIDSGHYFLDLVHDLEKISDHCSNIAIYIIQQVNGAEGFNTHSYLISRNKQEQPYLSKLAAFEEKYLKNMV